MVRSKNDQPKWVFFKYEQLPTFCYSCGYLGHLMKDCAKTTDEDEDSDHGLQYGDWFHA